ncbi:hypothetical protein IGJ11_002663 [Enterococcus sp. DIV0691]
MNRTRFKFICSCLVGTVLVVNISSFSLLFVSADEQTDGI